MSRPNPKPPTIQRRRLAAELRLLRERARLTLEDVAQRLGWSVAKISRIETAVVGISAKDLSRLLDLYEVTGERRTALLSKSRTARTKGWWDAYAEFVPSDYIDYIEVEAQLAGMRCYDAHVIHGLMQTESYAREVIRAGVMGLSSPAEIERRVEVRMTRQQVLTREDKPLRFWTVIAEPALMWMVGSPKIMAEQYEKLRELASLDNVTLQILPVSAGAHPGTTGAFHILEFPSPHEPDVVYVETMTANRYVESHVEIYRYSLAFDHLRAMALSPASSLEYLAQAAEKVMNS
ncbi:helix-turn-helix domain-containing protein [Thermasporomyces composti]|jgi:transcriptional regulator with XRE-family HTH domain|uniref:Helix-turn-helix protein n=1 Tax=Thermasporomyces composti TaxID=696763 RepID=A0A3D9UZ09_THECX|nr:helix-turn-helix transcriptional regulator [Thermasporomyces composti]REF34772.1 helix-turn-helix protein [Thermasporomyces composti]